MNTVTDILRRVFGREGQSTSSRKPLLKPGRVQLKQPAELGRLRLRRFPYDPSYKAVDFAPLSIRNIVNGEYSCNAIGDAVFHPNESGSPHYEVVPEEGALYLTPEGERLNINNYNPPTMHFPTHIIDKLYNQV